MGIYRFWKRRLSEELQGVSRSADRGHHKDLFERKKRGSDQHAMKRGQTRSFPTRLLGRGNTLWYSHSTHCYITSSLLVVLSCCGHSSSGPSPSLSTISSKFSSSRKPILRFSFARRTPSFSRLGPTAFFLSFNCCNSC